MFDELAKPAEFLRKPTSAHQKDIVNTLHHWYRRPKWAVQHFWTTHCRNSSKGIHYYHFYGTEFQTRPISKAIILLKNYKPRNAQLESTTKSSRI